MQCYADWVVPPFKKNVQLKEEVSNDYFLDKTRIAMKNAWPHWVLPNKEFYESRDNTLGKIWKWTWLLFANWWIYSKTSWPLLTLAIFSYIICLCK